MCLFTPDQVSEVVSTWNLTQTWIKIIRIPTASFELHTNKQYDKNHVQICQITLNFNHGMQPGNINTKRHKMQRTVYIILCWASGIGVDTGFIISINLWQIQFTEKNVKTILITNNFLKRNETQQLSQRESNKHIHSTSEKIYIYK